MIDKLIDAEGNLTDASTIAALSAQVDEFLNF
jgi:hypothetical protein